MLAYLSAPYSNVPDKQKLMTAVMKTSGEYMVTHPGVHVISPLFNHFSQHLVPAMGTTYDFWSAYSRDLLRRCDLLLFMTYPGWDVSAGMQDELKLANELNIKVEYLNFKA